MQDFQPIPGLAGRIFTSSGSDAARRLRGYPSSSSSTLVQQAAPQQGPIKCPRCESSNTKFCYYNNYNLSQPRHFCKSCRRYWTFGGILRNVPVGGGCRKNSSKRTSKSSSSSKPDNKSRRKTAESGSSGSESSSLTASNPNPEPEPEPNPIMEDAAAVFPVAAAGFSCLIEGAGADQAQGGFNFSDPGLLSGYRTIGDPDKSEAAAVELQLGKGVNGSGLDWSGSLFDIASSVDPSAYWNQNHWGDADPSLFLP